MAKKILNKKETHTELDVTTGEFKRIITDTHIGYVDTEPDYIKIYLNTQLCINNLDPNLSPYIIAFGPHMTYANDSKYSHMVRTDIMCREDVAQTLGVSVRRVEQIIQLLVDNGIFIPIIRRVEECGVMTEKKRRGMYFVNPFYVAKGSWKDIKQLRQEIDFVKGVSSCLISDSDGQRQISCCLPQKFSQMELEDFIDVK